jgi:hypothetical protein
MSCFGPKVHILSLTNSVVQELECSSPHLQQPATGPCPEPVESNPHPPKPISPRSILIPSSHLRLGLPSGLFPSGFHTKTLYTFISSPMRATYPAHLIFFLDMLSLLLLKYSGFGPALKEFYLAFQLVFPCTCTRDDRW